MFTQVITAILCATLSVPSRGGEPEPAECFEMMKWFHEAFAIEHDEDHVKSRIQVEYAHDLVQMNSHMGRPFVIRGEKFSGGLYCHAPTKLIIFTDKPIRAFHATLGILDNEQTRIGQSSVEFIVSTESSVLYRSPIIHYTSAPLEINVPLDGVNKVLLELTDAGDGIHSDQGVWADPWFEMDDGTHVPLHHLPVIETALMPKPESYPFSFMYGGQTSEELLPTWAVTYEKYPTIDGRTQHHINWRDPDTGLNVRCEAIAYDNFPVSEWTVYFKNEGSTDTPMLEHIHGLDLTLTRHPLLPEYEFVLNHNRGTVVTTKSVPEGRRDWEPLKSILEPDSKMSVVPPQGRPSAGEWPYFNIESMGTGLIFAVGWPGQWSANFTRDVGNSLHVTAGQATTRFVLRPGESVRTPLMVVQCWRGSREHAQNVWRRWMQAHVLPRPGGLSIEPKSGAFCGYYFPDLQITEAGELEYLSRYVEEKMIPDYWWIDAGWYPCNGSWVNTGTWIPDPERFPNGLRAVTNAARSHGMKSVVWFEPERVTPGTYLYNEHPEWLLDLGDAAEGTRLLNLGNPEARTWITDHIDNMIRDEGIDIYRQDFNMPPLPYWQAHDTTSREGITENLYVQGYLAFWDALLERHPNLIIDTCASGAHRDDLETLRRSVPLWRSDWAWEPLSMQSQTYGLASWVPYYGTGTVSDNRYTMRSNMAPFFLLSWDMRNQHLDYDELRLAFNHWKRIADYYLGDFHPLTPYSLEEDVWMAWQFHRSDLDGGLIQVFRRRDSIYESARLPLAGLIPEATYSITNLDDEATSQQFTGIELEEHGLPVAVSERPDALIILYQKVLDDQAF